MPRIEDIPRHPSWNLDQQLLRETAYHEAGHAVLAKLTGTYLVGAISTGSRSEHGSFESVYLPSLRHARDAELGVQSDADLENAVINAAGAVAQARFMRENGIGLDGDGKVTKVAQDYVFCAAIGDVEQVRDKLGSGQWQRVTTIAAKFLSDKKVWRAVETLAAEIIRLSGVMSSEAVDDVLHEAFVELDLPEYQILA